MVRDITSPLVSAFNDTTLLIFPFGRDGWVQQGGADSSTFGQGSINAARRPKGGRLMQPQSLGRVSFGRVSFGSASLKPPDNELIFGHIIDCKGN